MDNENIFVDSCQSTFKLTWEFPVDYAVSNEEDNLNKLVNLLAALMLWSSGQSAEQTYVLASHYIMGGYENKRF